MMKIIFLLLSLSCLPLHQALASGHDVEDGGGGIIDASGNAITFGDSQFAFSLKDESAQDIPGLALVVHWLNQAPLPADLKEKILISVNPGAIRVYHRSAALKAALNSVTYLAVTDQEQRTTVLLAGFYQIQRPAHQAAILFREALACGSTGVFLTDQNLNDIATDFQALLENPSDQGAMTEFYSKMTAAFHQDLLLFPSLEINLKMNPQFQSYQGRFPVRDLFGRVFLECGIQNIDYLQDCKGFLRNILSGYSMTPLCKDSPAFCNALLLNIFNSKPDLFILFSDKSFVRKYHLESAIAISYFIDRMYFTIQSPEKNEAIHLKVFEDERELFDWSFLNQI